MTINVRGRILPITAVSALALGLTACGGSSEANEGSDLEVELTASGASFPDAYYQSVIESFAEEAPGVVINYEATGSGTGKEQFSQNLNDFAGSDSLVSKEDGIKSASFLYVPTVAAPITISYNLPGVDDLQVSPDTLAGIFQTDIKKWNDPAIAKDNPDADLPDTDILVAHRSDGSGTTNNFSSYLDDASDDWKLGAGDEVEWPSSTEGGEKNTGVAQVVQQTKGAIGYVDLADAKESKLVTASVKNADGDYVKPTLDAATAALEGAEINKDLSYNPLNAEGADAYPITAPTYIMVRTKYDDADVASGVKQFVTYILEDGQKQAKDVNFAQLPDDLKKRALDQLDKIDS